MGRRRSNNGSALGGIIAIAVFVAVYSTCLNGNKLTPSSSTSPPPSSAPTALVSNYSAAPSPTVAATPAPKGEKAKAFTTPNPESRAVIERILQEEEEPRGATGRGKAG